MTKSAVIVAEAAEERRSIAQLIKPTDIFSQIHFCSSPQEANFLFKNTSVDILLCSVYSPGKEALRSTAELSSLAREHEIQLVFCSALDPVELSLLGIIPAGSHCLSYDSSSSMAKDLFNRLLGNHSASDRRKSFPPADKLIDQNSGIYNRFYFDAFLDQELSRSKLTGRPFSLLLIEPQADKNNETSGWSNLLPSVALSIKTQIRTSDLLCRIEKKRLALLLPETSNSNAKQVMQRIQNKAQELAKEIPIDLKIGLASPNLTNQFNRHGLLRAAEATF